jgi:hypothetical protein
MISRTSKVVRTAWSIAYLFFFLAGIVAFFTPSRVLERTLVEVLVYSWASFLTLGGGLCLFGKIRGTWPGELIGLPLLSVSSYIFGILLFLAGTSSAAIAIGGIFCGVGTAFVGRWVELRRLAIDNQGVNRGS